MVAFPDFEPTRNITRHKLQNKKGCNNSVNGAIIGTSNKGGWTATLPDCFVRKKSEKKAKKGLTDHSANGTMGTLNQRTHRNKETTKMNFFKTSDISITKDNGNTGLIDFRSKQSPETDFGSDACRVAHGDGNDGFV